jgi:hypothetical protein
MNDEKDDQTWDSLRKIKIEKIAAKIFIKQDFVSEHNRLFCTLMVRLVKGMDFAWVFHPFFA